MTEDLDRIKLQAEIEKIRAETIALRRRFAKASDWVAVFIGVGGILTAVAQWQISGIQKEKAALQAERRLLDAEKQLRKTEEVNRQLSQQVSRQQTVLTQIENKIQEKKILLSQISLTAGWSRGIGQTGELIQKAQDIDKAIAEDLQHLRVTWKGRIFQQGDKVRIVSRAGTFKPNETKYHAEVDAGPGQIGLVITGERRHETSYFKPDPSEPIQVVRVRWNPQRWKETVGEGWVDLKKFEASIHVDYLDIVH